MSTAVKSRQLNLDELRRLKWLLGGGMALVSLWTVFFLDIEALGLVGVSGGIILATLIWPQLPARVPSLVWKLAVPAIILAAAADFYLSPDTLPVLIRLAMLLVLYRAIAYRRKREDLQLIVLGLFLIVVAGVLTVSLGFAFLLLLFTACALGFLFVINLIDAAEISSTRLAETETAWTRLRWGKFFARLGAVADWRLLTFAVALFTAVVVMSGLLFVMIPRFDLANGFFIDRYITRKSRTGFTETVGYGDVTDLTRDDSVAMRVDLTDSSGLREAPYWRMVVLDEYSPRGFKVSASLKGELLRSQATRQVVRNHALGREANSVGGVWTFYVEAGVSRFLPLPGNYSALRLRDPVPLQVVPSLRIAALRTEAMTMTAFQLEGVELGSAVADGGLFARLLREARTNPGRVAEQSRYNPLIDLDGPAGAENHTALKRVLEEITGGTKLSAEEFGKRASGWLGRHHTYALTVKLPAGEDRDDIVRWLDSVEPGYCEYFAGSLTVLARAAGYPARMVVGFHGGVLNAFENYYMVKNADAHAWVEIYDGQAAWLRFDPTRSAGAAWDANLTQNAPQTEDSSWSARWDSLRVLWYRRIVNFDTRAQVQMLEQVKSFTTDSTATLRSALEAFSKRLKGWVAGPWNLGRFARAGAVLAGAAALAWAGWSLIRWVWVRWQARRRPGQFDPVRQRAGRWLVKLREPVKSGGAGAEIHAVTAELQRLRYGRRESWPEPAGVFKRARRAVGRGKRDA